MFVLCSYLCSRRVGDMRKGYLNRDKGNHNPYSILVVVKCSLLAIAFSTTAVHRQNLRCATTSSGSYFMPKHVRPEAHLLWTRYGRSKPQSLYREVFPKMPLLIFVCTARQSVCCMYDCNEVRRGHGRISGKLLVESDRKEGVP